MHPLEPLTKTEVEEVVEILHQSGNVTSTTRFISIYLQEPKKQDVFALKPGESLNRRAFVVLFDNATNSCFESVVELGPGSQLVSWVHVPDVQPMISPDEMKECKEVLLRSPEFREAIKSHYGITDNFENITCDIWAAGYYGNDGCRCGSHSTKARLVRPLCFFPDPETKSPYAGPIEGLRPVVDLNKMEVIRIEDYGKWPLPPTHECAYKAHQIQNIRPGLKPLKIVQTEGPSFRVEGNQVFWQNWSFVVGFSIREGLTLHDLRYYDPKQQRDRSILYRASMSEVLVPYGDPTLQHAMKNAFDVGDFGIGMGANSLKLGCDCLGTIHYFDAHLCTSRGHLWTIENAICLHEEDYGILWKHTDKHSGATEVQRSRRLVISFFTSLGNYDYGFYWYLYQDANIELEVKLTGFLSLGALHPEDQKPKYGRLVAPQLYGPNHQHFFNVRLDFALDGVDNSVSRIDAVGLDPAGPNNPFKNGFCNKATLFKTEKQARDHVKLESSRTWEISNSRVKNSLGDPVTYRLWPRDNVFPLASKDAWWRKRAGFVDYHVWVTPFATREYFAAGEYPNQHPGGDGLVKWTEKDRPIADTDCVLWYTFGVTHVPRVEDYPVVPVVYAGFTLKPNGFFDTNPAFDLPPQEIVNRKKCSHMCE